MFNGKNPEDLKNSSPHSGYVCVIGCGDYGVIPPKDFYYDVTFLRSEHPLYK